MRHRTLTCSAGASLLMLLVTGILWARSYWRCDAVDWAGDRGSRSFNLARGHFVIHTYRADWSANPEFHRAPRYARVEPIDAFDVTADMCGTGGDVRIRHEFAGLGWFAIHNDRLGVYRDQFVIPFRFVALLATVLPLTWSARRWRARRARDGNFCPTCGYDL